jgi:hypothetical protein
MIAIWVAAMALGQEPAERALEDLPRKIEEAFRKGDPAALDRAIDVEALLDRALKGVGGASESLAGFRNGVKKSFQFGPRVAQQLGTDGTYTFLRVRRAGAERRAVFRMLVGESYSYQEFLLESRAGGEPRIADVYIHLSAEWMSESLRRGYLSLLAKEPGALAKALGAENEYAKHLPRISEFSKLAREGKHAEALKAWAELPAEVRKEKSVLVVRCTAALQVGGEEALRALEDLKAAVPGDPCISVLSIGPLTDAGKDAEALRAVDDLDRAVGGDPFLHVVRSWIHSGAGRGDRARESARKAVEGEKGLAIAYWTLINLSLREKKFAETAKALSELEAGTGARIDELKGEPFAEFVKSPEYEAWLRSRRKP